MQESQETLTIQEASARLNVTKHTLRFWERELGGLLVPLRSKGGQRRYTKEHLRMFEYVKRLKMKGLRLTEIKREFSVSNNLEMDGVTSKRIDDVADQIAEAVRAAMQSLLENSRP